MNNKDITKTKTAPQPPKQKKSSVEKIGLELDENSSEFRHNNKIRLNRALFFWVSFSFFCLFRFSFSLFGFVSGKREQKGSKDEVQSGNVQFVEPCKTKFSCI